LQATRSDAERLAGDSQTRARDSQGLATGSGADRAGIAHECFIHERDNHEPTAKGLLMPKRPQRSQASSTTDDDLRPLVVRPLVQTDRIHNPDDIEVDEAAIAAGVQHGGTLENRAESLQVRGKGGRKRSGARGRHRRGRDLSKKRL
jgi:hypothetical protein